MWPFEGVSLIALGIGSHVNMAELHQMTGDPELAFDNQTLAQSIEKASAKIASSPFKLLTPFKQFTDTFHRLSTAELWLEIGHIINGAFIIIGEWE